MDVREVAVVVAVCRLEHDASPCDTCEHLRRHRTWRGHAKAVCASCRRDFTS